MYAVIKTGGKQERVTEGQRLQVELLRPSAEGDVSFTPLLLVDGADVVADADGLARAVVSARVVGETKGPKVVGFTYKAKTNNRRHWGHRQRYSTIEITGIAASPAESSPAEGSSAQSNPA